MRQKLTDFVQKLSSAPAIYTVSRKNIPDIFDCFRLTFSYKAPSIWNSLPLSVRHCTSHSIFKRHLKTYLLSL